MHDVLFAQYVFLPTEQAESYLKIYVLYLSQLVRLEGKHESRVNREFQTLNLLFPGYFDRFWVFQKECFYYQEKKQNKF